MTNVAISITYTFFPMTSTLLYGRPYANNSVCVDMHNFCLIDIGPYSYVVKPFKYWLVSVLFTISFTCYKPVMYMLHLLCKHTWEIYLMWLRISGGVICTVHYWRKWARSVVNSVMALWSKYIMANEWGREQMLAFSDLSCL